MNDTYIVTVFAVLDDLLKAYAYQEDCRAQSSASRAARSTHYNFTRFNIIQQSQF